MKFNYLFFTLLTLTAFAGCNKCLECENLYYEPAIRVVFMDTSGKDSVKVKIKSFNGDSSLTTVKGDSSFINRKRSRFYFPIKIDSTETYYTIRYDVYKKDTVEGTVSKKRDSIVYKNVLREDESRSFIIEYSLEPYFYNDRRLFRAIMEDVKGGDSVNLSCTRCSHTEAIIFINE